MRQKRAGPGRFRPEPIRQPSLPEPEAPRTERVEAEYVAVERTPNFSIAEPEQERFAEERAAD